VSRRVIILALAALAFGSSLWSPFFFDDYALAADPAVTKAGGIFELLSPERTRPLTYATFWVNFQLAGFEPVWFHLVNLVLFALIIWLAGDLFFRVAGEQAGWIALAVFALHPLQTEAVAYVFARAILPAALFCLLSWRAWLDEKPWRAAAWFGAALLSKEEAAAFPLFLAGFDWFYRQRRQGWNKLLRPLAAMAGLVALFAARLLYATRVVAGSGAGFDLGEITPWTYLLSQGRAIWLYFRLFVAPVGQNFDRDFPLTRNMDAASVAGWLALLGLVFAGMALSRRWKAAWWFAGAVILLAPSSSIAPLADLTAERRMFLPMLSLALLCGESIAFVAGRRTFAAGAVLAAVLAAAGFQRTKVFSSEITLWRDVAAKSPNKVRPKLQLARALEAAGPAAISERAALLEQARSLAPDDPEALGELGVFYLQTSDSARAADAFREAIRQDPRNAQLRTNLGTSLALLGRLADAEIAYREALDADACNFDARNNLMLLLRQRGESVQARELAKAPPACPFNQEQLDALEAARDAP
jgi:Flp pilus assembly protein TadD